MGSSEVKQHPDTQKAQPQEYNSDPHSPNMAPLPVIDSTSFQPSIYYARAERQGIFLMGHDSLIKCFFVLFCENHTST